MPGPITLGAERVARQADTLGAAFAAELARTLKALERKLGQLLPAAAEGNRTAIVKGAQANQARKAIQDALTEAGWPELAATAYGDKLDALTAEVLAGRKLAKASGNLARGVPGRLEALKLLGEQDLLHVGDELAHQLWRSTVRGVFASRPPSQILKDLGALIDDTEPHIQTFYDTSVSIYGRQVEALQAGDDPDTPFAYLGPNDDLVRPFCAEHLGKVYSRAEIDAMDNGQLDNVFLTGGGYNCRHQWVEVSALSEAVKLQGTDEALPEFQTEAP